MLQPKNFVHLDCPKKVYSLFKTIYDLKQLGECGMGDIIFISYKVRSKSVMLIPTYVSKQFKSFYPFSLVLCELLIEICEQWWMILIRCQSWPL